VSIPRDHELEFLSWDPTISADGRFVVFDSAASNAVAGDTNQSVDVFIRDRVLGITERVSVSSAGHRRQSRIVLRAERGEP
jgi:hypothetical protein